MTNPISEPPSAEDSAPYHHVVSTCGSCRHWQQNADVLPEGVGYCHQLATQVDVYGKSGAQKFGYTCELLPKAEFGCNLWEASNA